MTENKLNKISKNMIDPAYTKEIDDKIGLLSETSSNHESRLNTLEDGSNMIATNVSGLYRETAYLKLKQQAADRIENGVTFADDFEGNIFGFTLNKAESVNIQEGSGRLRMIGLDPVGKIIPDVEAIPGATNSLMQGEGRKIVKMDNGWIITGHSSSAGKFFLVNKNDGNGFVSLCRYDATGTQKEFAMATYKNKLYVVIPYLETYTRVWIIDPLTIGNVHIGGILIPKDLQNNSTAIREVAIYIDQYDGSIHVAWAAKAPPYPNSYNIFYSVSTDGETFSAGAVTTVANNTTITGYTNPSVVSYKGKPVMAFTGGPGTASQAIYILRKTSTGSGWASTAASESSERAKLSPSLGVDNNGKLHLAYTAYTAANQVVPEVYYTSSNNGGETVDTSTRLTFGGGTYGSEQSVLALDKEGTVFVAYRSKTPEDPSNYYLRIQKLFDGTWSDVTPMQVAVWNPSLCVMSDSKVTDPLIAYQKRSSPESIKVNGKWTDFIPTQKLTSKLVYDIPATDYVGAFIKKIGAVSATAFLNDVPMRRELEGDEYLFDVDKPLPAPVQAKLRIELQRATVDGGENDAVTRILGGRS